jgi:hypothetical protein
LIEKREEKQKDLLSDWCPIDWYYVYVEEIIDDLKSLQEPTEEITHEWDYKKSMWIKA